MKVMFLFQGLPHYYNYVLNQIESVENIELVNVIPSNHSKGIGEGVFETKKDIQFQLCELEEYQPLWGGFFFRSFWKLILNQRPDIIVTTEAHLPGFAFDPLTRLVIHKLRIPLILKSHPFRVNRFDQISPGFLKKLKAYTWRYLYRLPKALVCYIEEAYTIFGSYGVSPEKIFITYNSPDTNRLLATFEKLSQSGIPKYSHRLIHVGRLVEWKRVDLLIQVIAQLKEKYSDIELVVVGEGPEMPKLKKLAEELKVHNNVHFKGGVYEPEVLGEMLLSSAIYVLAGMGGLSINEAMCFGLPVICSVCDGTEKHLVREGINGLFFKEGDVTDLKTKIDYLFTRQQLRTKMGLESVEIIRKEININTVVQGYLKAFNYARKCGSGSGN